MSFHGEFHPPGLPGTGGKVFGGATASYNFLRNGVRKSVIPVLISYFQNRKMKVKWHSKLSTQRDLPGVGLRAQA